MIEREYTETTTVIVSEEWDPLTVVVDDDGVRLRQDYQSQRMTIFLSAEMAADLVSVLREGNVSAACRQRDDVQIEWFPLPWSTRGGETTHRPWGVRVSVGDRLFGVWRCRNDAIAHTVMELASVNPARARWLVGVLNRRLTDEDMEDQG